MKWFKVLLFLSCILPTLYVFSQPFGCGDNLPEPSMSPGQFKSFELQLISAKHAYDAVPKDADALIWYARRLGYLARYQEAIDVLTLGIQQHPSDARMQRHRGHRSLTLRCLDKAIADFERAAQLVEGKDDEVEPDGQPNAANIPTSTLKSNIFYHLGLAYYLQKNFAKALSAYEKCLLVSTNPDMFTATANWYYVTLRRMGKDAEAEKFLQTVDFEIPLLENEVYRKLLLLHKNKTSATMALQTAAGGGDVQSATYLYGLYLYLHLNNYQKEAREVREMLLKGNQYASFGYIAAEME
jgi:tetratricopeptide (TPR) repeat protein